MPTPTRIRLTDRDTAVLTALGSYRFLSLPQLQTLFFPSNESTRDRLKKLHGARLVTEVYMPARPHDRRVSTIYALARAGADCVHHTTGERLKHLSEREHRSGLFLDHTLRRNDVRICLELLDKHTPGFRLISWRQTPEDVALAVRLKRRYSTVRIPLVPDGFFAVEWYHDFHGFLLEIDMGTVLLTRMETRYSGYAAAWKERIFHRAFGEVPFRVLTMTTTPARLASLQGAARRGCQGRSRGLFWFSLLTTADIHHPEMLLNAHWKRTDDLRGLSLRPLLTR